jgi:glycosyltransferase 2 family protein
MGKVKPATVLQYLLFLGLGLGLIWYSSKDLTPEQVGQLKASFAQTRYLYMLPVALALLLAHYARTLRWKLLMAPLGYAPSTTNTFLAVMIGYLVNLLVPRLGELMKCTVLAKYEKVAPDKLVGTIVAERAVDMVCLMLVILIMLATQFDLMGANTLELLKQLIAQKGGGINWVSLLLALGSLALVVVGLRWVFRRYGHRGPLLNIKNIVKSIGQGLTSIGRLKKPSHFLGYTLLIWSMYLASIWLGFKAFPAVETLGINPAVSILGFGSLGMIATQGGIGAYQWAVEKTLLLYQVAAVTGLAFGWLLWGAQTVFTLVVGLICLLFLPYYNQKKHAIQPSHSA